MSWKCTVHIKKGFLKLIPDGFILEILKEESWEYEEKHKSRLIMFHFLSVYLVTHTLSLFPASCIKTTGNFQLAPYFSNSPIRHVLVLKTEV